MFDAPVAPGRLGASTPAWLLRAGAAIVLLALLTGGACLWAGRSVTDVSTTIGTAAEPSVALALNMSATLARMNAAALSDSLTGNGQAAGTSREFRTANTQMSADLVEAGRDITYGAAEIMPLTRLQDALAMYREAVVESRYIGAGDPWVTARRVQWASRVNRDFAIPQAEALAAANDGELNQRWAAYEANWLLQGLTGLVWFAALIAMLIIAQVWLLRRTRRLLNPLLAAATVVCVAAALWFASTVLAEHAMLRTAKKDAYDSLHVLFQAKMATSAMRAEASLWLLDPTTSDQSLVRIRESEQALLKVDRRTASPFLADLRAALTVERTGNAAVALANAPHVDGLLGQELSNITFGVPEREAATEAVTALLRAEAVVQEVQARAGADRSGAVAQWLEPGSPRGEASFQAVQDALDRTIQVNQTEFDSNVAAAQSLAGLLALVTSGALALVVLLAGGGLWLRLREYR